MPRQIDIVASAPRGGRKARPSPTTHRASTFPRAMLRPYGAPIRAPSASAGTDALPSSKVRSRYPYTRLSTLSRNGVPQASASESRHPRLLGRALRDWPGLCSSLIRAIGFNLLLLTLASQIPMPKGIRICNHLPRGPPIDVISLSSDAVRTAHSQVLYSAPDGGHGPTRMTKTSPRQPIVSRRKVVRPGRTIRDWPTCRPAQLWYQNCRAAPALQDWAPKS